MKIILSGIPSYAGALYSGTELAPEMIRRANLISKLESYLNSVVDLGDIKISNYYIATLWLSLLLPLVFLFLFLLQSPALRSFVT